MIDSFDVCIIRFVLFFIKTGDDDDDHIVLLVFSYSNQSKFIVNFLFAFDSYLELFLLSM